MERFDMVITPQHDYYPLTPHAQEQVPRLLRKWITPQEPPDKHVVSLLKQDYYILKQLRLTEPLFLYLNLFTCVGVFQVLTVGALHQIDAPALRNAASAWHDVFAPLPKPLVVINIGGPTSKFRIHFNFRH